MVDIMKNIVAAIVFFTRIPLWRFVDINIANYKNVVNYWPIVGLITGGVMATLFYLLQMVFPVALSIILALAARTLVTGALHEDGLADCFDGFGGGRTKERILEIMKDSHIGSYGVIGLIFYYLLYTTSMENINLKIIAPLFLVADVVSKFLSSQIVNFLPYARGCNESKNKVVYNRIPLINNLINGVIAIGGAVYLLGYGVIIVILGVAILTFILFFYYKRKIGGYTGDCCGATALLSELAFILISLIVLVKYGYIFS